jgi:ATP-binding cassette subfamily B protein
MTKQSKMDLTVFYRLMKFAKPYRKYLVIALFCTLFLSVLSPLRPQIIGDMVQKYVVDEDTRNANQFLKWTIFVVFILIGEAILQFFASYYSNFMAQSIIHDIRKKTFAHMLTFRMKYFDKTPVGSMVTRVVSDIEAISEVFSSGLIDLLGNILMLIIILVLMFINNWHLSLLALLPIPILLIATRIFARAMKKSFQQESSAVNKLNSFVQERITGMNIVQIFGREKREQALFEEVNAEHRQAHINAVWAFSIFFPVVDFLSSLSMAFLIVWAAFTMNGDHLSNKELFGTVFSFTLWIQMLFRPIRVLADKFNILQRGIVRANRVFDTIDTQGFTQQAGSQTQVDFNQAITFENVYFAYSDENWVLKNINLTIKPKEIVAFVGATGAGKTSIVNLLSRFYEYQQGTIHVGSVELREIHLETLRKQVAIVLQDVFLFSDSIHNNITLGNAEISREQVIEAAKAIGAHEFISKLPHAYDYQVGERGGVLSVGQRQMIAFIRAYVYNPHLLILDEATSSVDSESEELIQRATEKLTRGRTSIVIAHRLSTIQSADTIIVLDKGEIKEQGNHATLLQQNGLYKKLHTMQFSQKEHQ